LEIGKKEWTTDKKIKEEKADLSKCINKRLCSFRSMNHELMNKLINKLPFRAITAAVLLFKHITT
jgi:hypothetical protein